MLRRTALKRKSKKQIERDKEWAKVKLERQVYLNDKYGFDICESCGKAGHVRYDPEDFAWLTAHHIDRNRRNNNPSNAYIAHLICHGDITRLNLNVVQEDFRGVAKHGREVEL